MNLPKILFIIAVSALFISCKKTTDALTGPIYKVTPLQNTGVAGDIIGFDVSGTSTAGVNHIKVVGTYTGHPAKTFTDSGFSAQKTFTFAYYYKIPDSAKAGQQTDFTFTLTDVNGKSSSKDVTIKITGSRPQITATGWDTTVTPGRTMNIQLTMTSVDPNLGRLQVKESLKGAAGVTTLDTTFNGQDKKVILFTYPFTVPGNLQKGDIIILLFTAINKEGIQNSATAKMIVQ